MPVRNEAPTLPRLVAALAAQRNLDGRPLDRRRYEVLLLLNNCTDHSAAVAARLRRRYPALRLRVSEAIFPSDRAHVGWARRALCDAACHRLASLGRPRGLILTTDADSRPAIDWIAQTQREIDGGREGVGGRVLLEPGEAAAMDPEVRRLFLLDIGYRRALEQLRDLYVPDEHDPFPRHHQHFGASLAITTEMYQRVGGMPPLRSNEDVALYRAIIRSGGRFRHSMRVRVFTSARAAGRAEGGLADAIAWWTAASRRRTPVLVESARDADERLRSLGEWCRTHARMPPPDALSETPRVGARTSVEIHQTIQELRARIAVLGRIPLERRLHLRSRQPVTAGTRERLFRRTQTMASEGVTPVGRDAGDRPSHPSEGRCL